MGYHHTGWCAPTRTDLRALMTLSMYASCDGQGGGGGVYCKMDCPRHTSCGSKQHMSPQFAAVCVQACLRVVKTGQASQLLCGQNTKHLAIIWGVRKGNLDPQDIKRGVHIGYWFLQLHRQQGVRFLHPGAETAARSVLMPCHIVPPTTCSFQLWMLTIRAATQLGNEQE